MTCVVVLLGLCGRMCKWYEEMWLQGISSVTYDKKILPFIFIFMEDNNTGTAKFWGKCGFIIFGKLIFVLVFVLIQFGSSELFLVRLF